MQLIRNDWLDYTTSTATPWLLTHRASGLLRATSIAQPRCGIAPEQIEALARDLVSASSAGNRLVSANYGVQRGRTVKANAVRAIACLICADGVTAGGMLLPSFGHCSGRQSFICSA